MQTAVRRPTAPSRPSQRPVSPCPVFNQTLTGISLPRVPLQPHSSLLQNDPRPEADNETPSILKAEVEEAVRSLYAGKSSEMENVPSELI
ncbi:hypothetical protein DPMN_170545 [Dreissena polymorpha]|uniref:Uncharacterized protein n=1 Tax=Dreissena polymorpha TaxID=45954 RepID=A0A9D4ICZ0_DREPO|nr:hypothetical protein DPMN_170545 [Dreissena polymorpha]